MRIFKKRRKRIEFKDKFITCLSHKSLVLYDKSIFFPKYLKNISLYNIKSINFDDEGTIIITLGKTNNYNLQFFKKLKKYRKFYNLINIFNFNNKIKILEKEIIPKENDEIDYFIIETQYNNIKIKNIVFDQFCNHVFDTDSIYIYLSYKNKKSEVLSSTNEKNIQITNYIKKWDEQLKEDEEL